MFCVGFRIQYETPKKDLRIHRPKRCEYKNKDEGISLNALNDKDYQAFFQKFIQIITISIPQMI